MQWLKKNGQLSKTVVKEQYLNSATSILWYFYEHSGEKPRRTMANFEVEYLESKEPIREIWKNESKSLYSFTSFVILDNKRIYHIFATVTVKTAGDKLNRITGEGHFKKIPRFIMSARVNFSCRTELFFIFLLLVKNANKCVAIQ